MWKKRILSGYMLLCIVNNDKSTVKITNCGTPSFKGLLKAKCSICDKTVMLTGPIYISRTDQKPIEVITYVKGVFFLAGAPLKSKSIENLG